MLIKTSKSRFKCKFFFVFNLIIKIKYKKNDNHAQQKKSNVKGSKDAGEKYPPPEIDVLTLDDNYMFKCSLNNEYQAICGAFDAKEHPLASFIVEKNMFNRRNEYGKTPFDLASLIGNKDFIRTILQRTDDKLDENIFSLRNQLKPSNAYNFMHYACIWGRLELVKFLVDQSKLIADPSIDAPDPVPAAPGAKNQAPIIPTKTLGSILLKSKTKNGETPKDLAKRYNHTELIEFLEYAGRFKTII